MYCFLSVISSCTPKGNNPEKAKTRPCCSQRNKNGYKPQTSKKIINISSYRYIPNCGTLFKRFARLNQTIYNQENQQN